MYIKIHRGTSQIGGNIIEIGTKQTRLIFDAGSNLPPLDDSAYRDTIEISGLTYGEASFDAVFISHHHNDHCGLIGRILPEIPIWAGRETSRILKVISDFTNDTESRITNFFLGGGNCLPCQIGDIRVTPIGVDHSAYDAYMFLIQADGKNVLYTGDYRAVEEIPETVRNLLGIAGKLDVLITEGTNIRAIQQANGNTIRRTLRDESTILQEAAEIMQRKEGTVFVLCSSTNEQRIRAINSACMQTERIPCQDLFMTAVRGELAKEDSCKHQAFVANRVNEFETPRTYRYFDYYFDQNRLVGAEVLAKQSEKQTVFVRTSMLPFLKKYLNARGGDDHTLIYSMWEGYKQTEPVQKMLEFFKERGIETVSLHCSGHAYKSNIKELIWKLQPTTLIPIHCDRLDRGLFEQMHPNCKMLGEGELLEV